MLPVTDRILTQHCASLWRNSSRQSQPFSRDAGRLRRPKCTPPWLLRKSIDADEGEEVMTREESFDLRVSSVIVALRFSGPEARAFSRPWPRRDQVGHFTGGRLSRLVLKTFFNSTNTMEITEIDFALKSVVCNFEHAGLRDEQVALDSATTEACPTTLTSTHTQWNGATGSRAAYIHGSILWKVEQERTHETVDNRCRSECHARCLYGYKYRVSRRLGARAVPNIFSCFGGI